MSARTRHDFERAATEAAHEIAGPLAAVRASIELACRRELDDEDTLRELLQIARRHVILTQGLLARFARLETGVPAPDRHPTDLVDLVAELVDDLATSLLTDHPTHLEPHQPVTARVDPGAIRQVLFNLLSNAVRYSEPGGEIRLEIASRDTTVELRVSDQGHGVAPEDADRIFERYERGESQVSGTGLGLALSREIARTHGGDLLLETAERAGATFLLVLPLADPADAGDRR